MSNVLLIEDFFQRGMERSYQISEGRNRFFTCGLPGKVEEDCEIM